MHEFNQEKIMQNIADPLKHSESVAGQAKSEKSKEVLGETLVDLRKIFLEKLDVLDDDETLDTKGKIEEKQKIISNFIDELLANKEKFSKVFQTENGSFYFVSEEGQSWRFKREEDGELREQPMLNKIVFLSPEEKDRFLELKNSRFFQENLVAFQGNSQWIPEDQRKPYKIKKADFEEGNFPLEIGAYHLPEVIFNETDDSIEILGVRKYDGSIEKCFSSGIHLGHAITKIHKKN